MVTEGAGSNASSPALNAGAPECVFNKNLSLKSERCKRFTVNLIQVLRFKFNSKNCIYGNLNSLKIFQGLDMSDSKPFFGED